MSKYEDLEVWKLAHELVLEIYKLCQKFPADERFRLTDQLCRASSSIPVNICEGTGRNSAKDFKHFLYIARGSLQETKYLLLLSRDLGFIVNEEYDSLLGKYDTIGKLLNSLINRLK